ncbi:hypothetical protein Tco_1298334, partial [Tanacetum coccineum]
MRSKQSRVINDLRSLNKLQNWYQSLAALDLESTRFCRKVEDGVEGCKVRFLMVLFSEDTSGSWKSVAATKDIG